MSGKLEYLEKYSVAPSPSRDYYGLRVFNDQVTLYLWRISHGPHKTPIVRTSSFVDFRQDQRLQDEIQRIFGKYCLKHVQNIASGTNTLLTLPKNLIEKLIKYLGVQDIVKLSSVSNISNQIFNDNFVWEALYKRYRPSARTKRESLYTKSCNWKQLFQLAHMQTLTSEQKMLRPRPGTKQSKPYPKFENSLKMNLNVENLVKPDPKIENVLKNFHASTKTSSRIVPPENQMLKKFPEISRSKNAHNPVPKRLPDNRPGESTCEKGKIVLEKKPSAIKSLQMTGQKNFKTMKEQSIATKNYAKRDGDGKDLLNNKTADGKSNKSTNKVKPVDAKGSSLSIKVQDEKTSNQKLKNIATTKVNKTDRTPARSIPGDQTRPKTKGKAKKISQSRSTILNTSSKLVNDYSSMSVDTFDFADLIEASLKNIRSPRSIFDYSFRCMEKSKSCGGDTKTEDVARKMAEHPRALKSAQIKATLDRLSEKSEPLTAKSIDSVGKSEVSHDSATPKRAKTSNNELKRASTVNRNPGKFTLPTEKEQIERYANYKKEMASKIRTDAEQKKLGPRKEVDKMNVLRSLGLKTMYGKSATSVAAPETTRPEFRKPIDNIYKYL